MHDDHDPDVKRLRRYKLGKDRVRRILLGSLRVRNFVQLAKVLNYTPTYLYTMLYFNPEVKEAVSLIFAIQDEADQVREMVRWAKAIKRRVK